jgi:hypothetical protein
MVNWWNDTDRGNPEYREETMATPFCPTKNPTRTGLRLYTGPFDDRLVTN